METASVEPIANSRLQEFKYPEQVAAARRAALDWMPYLLPSEYLIVSWLIANTVLRGCRFGTYSAAQICNGVPNRRDGGMWARGTGLSERTVRTAVSALAHKGVISAEPVEHGHRLSVILSWNPATGCAEESNVVKLNLPRASRRAKPAPVEHVSEAEEVPCLDGEYDTPATIAPTPLQPLHLPPCNDCTPSNEYPSNSYLLEQEEPAEPGSTVAALPVLRTVKKNTKTLTGNVATLAKGANRKPIASGNVVPSPRCAAPPPANVVRFEPRESVAAAIEQANEARARRLTEARKRVDTAAYETTWAAAWARAYPGVPCRPWTKKMAGMLKVNVNANWLEPKRHLVHEFLEYVVENWDVLLGAKMSWMRESPPPSQPDIVFVARMMRSFQEGWAEREEHRFRGTLPAQKQRALLLAKRERITIDVALARVIAEDAAEAERARNEKLAADARRDRDMAFLAKQNAARATRFTKDNPHPRAGEHQRPAFTPLRADAPSEITIAPVVFGGFSEE